MSEDFLLKLWLLITSIPLLVKTIQCKQLMDIYLKYKKFFLNFFCIFRISIKFRTFLNKDDPHSLCISEITHHEGRA